MDAVGVQQPGQVCAGLGDRVGPLDPGRPDQRCQVGDRADGGVDAGGLANPGGEVSVRMRVSRQAAGR